jgi:DNA-binding protein Fis
MSSIVETNKTSMDNTDVLKNEISEMQKEHDTNANEIEELYEVIEGLEEEKKELQEEIDRLKSGGAKEEPVEKKDAKKEFAELFEKMYQLSLDNNWGDTFSYNRAREIHMANYLGHSVALNYSGADAIDQDGLEVEYKSTISKDIQATYNGISVHHNWESQETYIREHKIGKYKKHYYAKYQGSKIVEMYEMKAEDVLEFVLPKLKIQFEKERKNKKDPRLGVTIPKKYIFEKGTKISFTGN